MSDPQLDAARLALRQRQGVGARYDAAAAPARELSFARLGAAYFARKLNELHDDDLGAAIPYRPGWTRRHVVALIGYQARRLAGLVEMARTGAAAAPLSSAALGEQVVLGATLPARALRNLYHHAQIHLDVEWRDLPDSGWDKSVTDGNGRSLAMRQTAWLRARALWLGAVDLDNGASFRDFPAPVLDGLAADLDQFRAGSDHVSKLSVTGSQADIVRWLCGRGARRLTSCKPELPDLPFWCPVFDQAEISDQTRIIT